MTDTTGEPTKLIVLGNPDVDVAVTKYTAQDGVLAIALDNGDIQVVDTSSMKNMILHGCETAVWALALDDGKLASGSSGSEAEVRLWDLNSEKCTRLFKGHHATIRGLAFNPDTGCLASASRDSHIKIWNLEKNKEEHEPVTHTSPIRCLAVDKVAGLLMSAGDDGAIQVWNTRKNFAWVRTLHGHEATVFTLVVNEDRRLIASAGMGGQLMLWNTDDGRRLAEPKEHNEIVARVQFFADKLVTADSTGTMCIWSLQPLMQLLNKVSAHIPSITCLDSCQATEMIASGGKDHHVKIWNVLKELASTQLPLTYDTIWGVKWLPDGQLAVLACRDGIQLVEASDLLLVSLSKANGIRGRFGRLLLSNTSQFGSSK